MTSAAKRRLDKLASKAPGVGCRIFILWDGDNSTVTDDDGTVMTYGEYCQRHPGDTITLISCEEVWHESTS
jgi:hypothetical protein